MRVGNKEDKNEYCCCFFLGKTFSLSCFHFTVVHVSAGTKILELSSCALAFLPLVGWGVYMRSMNEISSFYFTFLMYIYIVFYPLTPLKITHHSLTHSCARDVFRLIIFWAKYILLCILFYFSSIHLHYHFALCEFMCGAVFMATMQKPPLKATHLLGCVLYFSAQNSLKRNIWFWVVFFVCVYLKWAAKCGKWSLKAHEFNTLETLSAALRDERWQRSCKEILSSLRIIFMLVRR